MAGLRKTHCEKVTEIRNLELKPLNNKDEHKQKMNELLE